MSEMGGDSGDGMDYTSGGETGGTETTDTTTETGTESEVTSQVTEGPENHNESGNMERVASVSEAEVSSSKPFGEVAPAVGTTTVSMEQAQQNVESFHKQSVDQIMEMNGKYIPESSKERINNGVDSIKAIEKDSDGKNKSHFSFSKGKSSIEVVNGDKTQMERSTKHETNHFTSFNREIIVPGNKGYTVHKTSGVRQASWFHVNHTGENIPISANNRGMNEGITTMYTNEQLAAMDPEKGKTAAQQGIYPHATELSLQLQEIVGKDAVAQAYYGGDIKGLEAKVDALAGEKGFENLSKCMEKVTYTKDPAERVSAMKEAQDILAKMNEEAKKA